MSGRERRHSAGSASGRERASLSRQSTHSSTSRGDVGSNSLLHRAGSGASARLPRSASNDKLLALKQRAERAAGKYEEDEEIEASFRAACLEIVLYALFVIIFGIVTWVRATGATGLLLVS
jgi:hypothetical protein